MPLSVVVPLSVDATAEARFREHFLVEFVLAAKIDLRFKRVDFFRKLIGKAPVEAFFPEGVTGFHRGCSVNPIVGESREMGRNPCDIGR